MFNCQKITFSGHAVQRMFEREIRKTDVISVIKTAEIIAEYLDDVPFPSYLLNGAASNRPLHVVVAVDHSINNCYVVTTYIPSPDQWTDGYKTRR